MSEGTDNQPPIWILVLALVLAAGSVALFRLDGFDPFGGSAWWMWTLAIAGFVAADATVVEVHSRSETLAFTFIEFPLFVTAMFLSPTVAWVTMIIGVAISAVLIQRTPLVKATFNIANASLQGALGLWIFHELLAGASPLGPGGWGAAAVAAIVSSAASALVFVLVLFMVQDDDALRGVGVTLFMGAVTSVTNVSIALIAASLLDYRPAAVVLLLVPTAVLYGAYFAFTNQRAQRDRVQGMHELALEVRSIRDQAGILPVLRLAAEHLDATSGELVLFPEGRSSGEAIKFSFKGDVERRGAVVSSELASAVDVAHGLTEPQVQTGSGESQPSMIGTIRGEGRPLGLLRFHGRLRDANFSSGDLAMFETIIEQLGLSLEKNTLGHAVNALERRGRQLQHVVNHDGLTGLASRRFLAARLESELAERRNPSLLYIDLDDFKDINDTYGHNAGDEVLCIIARRFESAVGRSDCVARIGGDEFAVLLGEFSDDVGVANSLLRVAIEPISISDGTVNVSASIGIARSGNDVDGATLLKRADVAMYSAKEQGKGTLAFSNLKSKTADTM